MSEGELVQGGSQGDSESVTALHDLYFDQAYDFCLRLLLDADAAADAAAAAFQRSLASLSSLPQPEAFQANLFSEALKFVLESALTVQRPTEGADQEILWQISPERLRDPSQTAVAQEEAGIVWESVSRLDPRDYALLDLHLRQGLQVSEIAKVFGIGQRSAQSGLDKLKRDTERDASALIMARRVSSSCPDLRQILLSLPIVATREQLRRTTERHAKSCAVCIAALGRIVSPLEVFTALAAVSPPAELREESQRRVIASGTTVLQVAPIGASSVVTPPVPPPATETDGSGEGRGGRRGPLVALSNRWQELTSGHSLFIPLGAAVIVLGAAGGIAWGTGMFGGSGGGGAEATPSATPTVTLSPTNTVPATATPTEAPSATPTPTESPTPEETATETPTAIPTVAVTETPTPTPAMGTYTPTPRATPSPTTTGRH